MRSPYTPLPAVMAYLVVLSFGLSDQVAQAQDARKAHVRPQFRVHNMPWFEGKPVSGTWGWHLMMIWDLLRMGTEYVEKSVPAPMA